MASISRLNTYKEQSSFYDAVAEKDANYVGETDPRRAEGT